MSGKIKLRIPIWKRMVKKEFQASVQLLQRHENSSLFTVYLLNRSLMLSNVVYLFWNAFNEKSVLIIAIQTSQ